MPIQFDAYQRAHLRDEEAEAPFNFIDEGRVQRAHNRERALDRLADQHSVWNFSIDPLTRTTSTLNLSTLIDFEHRRVLDARVETTLFCGYELILKHREPSDAVQITSRISGSASGAHTLAAAMALEMAGGLRPPPLAIIARNIGACGELMSESARALFVFAGPDFSEAAVSRTSLSLWGRAQSTSAPGMEIHGHETIADIMRGMNPMSGHLYLEALQMSRLAREIATLIFGKYPHPSSVLPGGIGMEPTRETFNQVLVRVNGLLDYAKKVTSIWDDLVEFFYAAEPRYRRVGELPGNLLSVGLWDDPENCDGTYHNCNQWGELRMSTPGVVVNSELRTTRLSDINIGIEEFVDHSHYEQWNHRRFLADPLSGPLSPWHPWNKETLPDPMRRDWKEGYTWSTAPRWDREVMETGPLARLWINAVGRKSKLEFIEQTRRGCEMNIPKGQRPAARLVWQIPERPNSLERNRARAYQLAYTGLVAYANLLNAFDYLRRGEIKMSTRFHFPEQSIGVGLWEGSNGVITHHLVINKRRIANYQIITPSDWMGSPRDSSGTPGIYEAALMNTPLLEECARSEDFTGIDLLRTIRSFDP